MALTAARAPWRCGEEWIKLRCLNLRWSRRLMSKRRILPLALAALLGAAVSAPAGAQIVINPIEKIVLKGKRGPKLTQPGFEAGEYSGFAGAMAFKRQGLGSKDFAKADIQIAGPGFAAPVTAHCEGGKSKLVIAWITWKRDDLTYNCSYGGGAPADAALTLAVGDGSFLAKLQQPLRAGELRWNGMTIRFDTKQVGGMPISAGKPLGYVFSRNGKEIGGVDLGGGFTPPSFFLPPKGSPDRDAMMVAALSLFYFQDPGGQ
jgi:hypothetical protein